MKKAADGALVPGMEFGYAFDDIGNRTSVTRSGRTTGYQANLLNQYTQIAEPRIVEVRGSANADATVTVNGGAPASRDGDLFSDEVDFAGDPTAGWKDVEVKGVLSAGGVNGSDRIAIERRQAYLPASPTNRTYDADGNLLADGKWVYTWDAENRLITMETHLDAVGSNGPVSAAERKRLEFTYDSQSRRIAKKVFNWDGATWALASHALFVYDAWNVIAEFDPITALTLTRSYVWGLDLSGSLQGAGGVGGLLLANSGGVTYAPTYDGNGNIIGLIGAADGSLSAEFEYDPFGNVVTSSGVATNACPFGYSTKFADSETGLLYYGFRFYDPVTGRWLSRDPIEEEGGFNLYGFVDNDPVNYFDNGGLRKDSSRNSYWRKWKKGNPNRDKSKDPQREKTLNRGCVGITCLNLGQLGMPDMSNCYRMRAQAEARQAEMKKNCECSGLSPNKTPAEPRLFSIHLWSDTGRDGSNPDVTFDSTTGKADLSNWDFQPQPGYVNFDYGWVNDSGTIQHANHLHDPKGRHGPMKVYESSETEWQRSYRDFNTEVWCVSCNKDRF